MSAASFGPVMYASAHVAALQVEGGVGVGQACRQAAGGGREVELGRTQLEVVPPLGLGIEAVRDRRDEVAARVRVGEVEDVLGRREALVRERRIARLEHLEALGERRGVATREVRADQRAGRRRLGTPAGCGCTGSAVRSL